MNVGKLKKQLNRALAQLAKLDDTVPIGTLIIEDRMLAGLVKSFKFKVDVEPSPEGPDVMIEVTWKMTK